MDIRMYEYPLAIAREGSFSRAAASLGISQSALSHSLSALERDLGVALFDRSTRYLKPTGSGRIFLEAAGQIAAVKQQTYQAIHMLGKPHTRELVIGMTPYNGARIYSYLFKEFYSLYPDIRLIQREGYMNSLKEAMRKKEIHLLIGTSSDYSEAGCRFVRFARQEVLLAVAKTHPLAARASALYGKTVSVSLKEMEDIPFLIPGPGSSKGIAHGYFQVQQYVCDPGNVHVGPWHRMSAFSPCVFRGRAAVFFPGAEAVELCGNAVSQ